MSKRIISNFQEFTANLNIKHGYLEGFGEQTSDKIVGIFGWDEYLCLKCCCHIAFNYCLVEIPHKPTKGFA